MKIFYIEAVIIVKGKEVEDTFAMKAKDYKDCLEQCGNQFVKFADPENKEGFQMNKDWDEGRELYNRADAYEKKIRELENQLNIVERYNYVS